MDIWKSMIFSSQGYTFNYSTKNGENLIAQAMEKAEQWISQNHITDFKISHCLSITSMSFIPAHATVVVMYKE